MYFFSHTTNGAQNIAWRPTAIIYYCLDNTIHGYPRLAKELVASLWLEEPLGET